MWGITTVRVAHFPRGCWDGASRFLYRMAVGIFRCSVFGPVSSFHRKYGDGEGDLYEFI